ncbi:MULTISPECIES: hypothetical protein [Flavobacterium]|uniref:hypothetical protein n=1 Tax=Flavobacterium TaxID=237 RepID=UPI00086DE4B9|nr:MULTISPECIES: hypothetical protein [Flavobacterium]MBN9283216.1 hypothetical protein [Flavobacterium sp.]ODS81893.1 MAG: hypothetical protein ABS44_18780 [Chryseobacterium sp. SCN 40-13]OJV67840.1 MAG: hypothetical protein BGO42_17620 [Flavobacterium sp. 40-81]
MKKVAVIILGALTVLSCDYFKAKHKPEAIARVNDSYLYSDEIKGLVPAGTSKEDSLTIVKGYIDRWATKTLLMDAAEVNLSDKQKATFDELIKQYTTDLYTGAYIEQIVKQAIDTVITNDELLRYYQANKENFKTTGNLVRLKYINLTKDNPKFALIRSRFNSAKKEDKKALETMTIQFKSYAFNDTVWVDMNQVYKALPFVTPDNRDRYITDGISYEYKDSLSAYLVKVNKVLERNQVAPFDYISPTIKQIILNNRKLEYIKKFEKEITNDAIKNKKYEVYK